MESNDVEYRKQREETVSKMRAQLPEYIVNCLVASGFYTLLQTKSPINTKPSALQIIHLRNKHVCMTHLILIVMTTHSLLLPNLFAAAKMNLK